MFAVCDQDEIVGYVSLYQHKFETAITRHREEVHP